MIRAQAERLNALQITTMRTKKFLGLHYAKCGANLRHIQEWAPIALRVPLGVIFFAHGAQKMFGWFGGYGWHGMMPYFTQSLHIPAPLAAAAIPVELLGRLAW